MRKLYYIPFLTIFLSIMVFSITVSATSWVELKPQEVVDRAEVIITGKYDFTSKPKPSSFVFHGLDFNIKTVYKGDVSEQIIIAGIDYNDVGWAEEFQNKDGEFLLFLEKSEHADFLTPVGGPNGMILVYNGQIEDSNDEKTIFFQDFLKVQPEKTIETTNETTSKTKNGSQDDKSSLLLYGSASVLIGFAVLFLLYRYNRKK